MNNSLRNELVSTIYSKLRSIDITSKDEVTWSRDPKILYNVSNLGNMKAYYIIIIKDLGTDEEVINGAQIRIDRETLDKDIQSIILNTIDAYLIVKNPDGGAYVIILTELCKKLDNDLEELEKSIMDHLRVLPDYTITNVTLVE